MVLCEKCKKAQATFHLTNIDPSGAKFERHLCEKCAVDDGLIQIQKPTENFTELLEGFLSHGKAGAAAAADLVCDECGISYVEFRNQGLLGCPHDYDLFKAPLARLIERAHDGAKHHTGKAPRSATKARPAQADLRQLKRQLEEAVAAEDYERAVALRDRIRKLEAG